jgi:DNA-binding CsgD family transcriptional regulator
MDEHAHGPRNAFVGGQAPIDDLLAQALLARRRCAEVASHAHAVERFANGLVEGALAAQRRARAELAAESVDPAPRAASKLTARQHEVLLLVSEGLGTKAIARRLWLSPATVRNHVSGALKALDSHSRLEAVAHARALGLLDGTLRQTAWPATASDLVGPPLPRRSRQVLAACPEPDALGPP